MAARQRTLESMSECPICMNPFDDPRILSCGHTFCLRCLQRHAGRRDRFNCPTCRHECIVPRTGITYLTRNFFARNVGDMVQEQDTPVPSGSVQGQSGRECHNNKKSKRPHQRATAFCVDCAEFYCESCTDNHMMFDLSSDHQIKPASEVDQTAVRAAEAKKRVPKCAKHPNQEINIYCDTCDAAVCTTCSVVSHTGHKCRELSQVGEQCRQKMGKLGKDAGRHASKLENHMKGLETSQHNIQRDTKTACQEVKQAADEMRDLVTKREKYLTQQIKDSEEAALVEIRAAYKETELQKASTQSLQTYIQHLESSGDVTDQINHVPGLQEQLNQQETVPLQSVTWTVSFKKETHSVAELNSMLGTVNTDSSVVKSPTTATVTGSDGIGNVVLGAPVNTLKPGIGGGRYGLSGIAVIGDIVCCTLNYNPYLWLYNVKTKTPKQHTLDGLKAVGMTTTHNNTNNTNTLVITDKNKRIHFFTINQQTLNITKHTTTDITFEPRRVSVEPGTGKLIVANRTDKSIVICGHTGHVEKTIPVKTDIGSMWCVLSTGGGEYIVLDYLQGKVHWVDGRGDATYGNGDGESLGQPVHMVLTSSGQLLVADFWNDRIHMVDANRRLSQYLLTKDDGIYSPRCLFLDETTSLLYVGQYDRVGDKPKVHVYKWPSTAPSTAQMTTHNTQHTVQVKLVRYK